MTYKTKAPKPRRGVGSVAATRKWRLSKDLAEMKEKRIAREKAAALNYMNRRRAESTTKIDGLEWGRMVVHQALDTVVAVARVADGLPDTTLHLKTDCHDFAAYTDFTNVTLNVTQQLTPTRGEDYPVTAEKLAVLKGAAYHELGHIKYTVRPWDLFTEPQRMLLHRVWNILEDQRMESWYTRQNPRLVSMFTIMISKIILETVNPTKEPMGINHWLLLAGREYLPDEVLVAAWENSSWDEDKREEWYQIVHRYKRAKNFQDMVNAVQEAYAFLSENGSGEALFLPFDEHELSPMSTNGGKSAPSSASPDLGADQGEGGETLESIKKQAGKNAELGITDQSLLEAVLKAKREAVDVFGKGSDVSTAVSRVNDILSTSSLPPAPNHLSQPMDAAVQAEAEALGEGMKRALSSFMTATDPYWENHQDVGVLDALAYRTKEPGDRNFRRHRHDFDGKGRNVHVSLLCDISGSMHGAPMLALSMALYGTARACDDLGIGRTMLLWSTVYHQIWEGTEPTPVVWNSCGGTEPIPALDTLDDHNQEDADNHLVLVFTDGAWYNQSPLTTWGVPGRKIVVLHYGAYANQEELGADEEIRIDNVTDIPDLLAQYIGDIIMGDT